MYSGSLSLNVPSQVHTFIISSFSSCYPRHHLKERITCRTTSLFQIHYESGSLVAEVLQNRPSCSLNFSVTCRSVPTQDVTRRLMQEAGNILHNRRANAKSGINTFLRTPYLSGCFISSVKFTFLDHKQPPFCYTFMWIFCLILANITHVGTLTLILALILLLLQIMHAPLTINLTKRYQ